MDRAVLAEPDAERAGHHCVNTRAPGSIPGPCSLGDGGLGCGRPGFLRMSPSDPDERRQRFESTALPLMQRLYNTALHLTGDADDAADVLQDTYFRAFRTFDNFRPGTNAKAWLFTILYSVFFNRRRKRQREVGPLPPDELEQRFQLYVEQPSHNGVGQTEAWGASWPREVQRALSALPEVFRAAVLLVDVEELSYEEAATALDCPVGTVQSRVFRARRMLHSALAEYARREGFAPPEGS
jgi:RNA polymerase sigma-70 factor (ECF subfamily)